MLNQAISTHRHSRTPYHIGNGYWMHVILISTAPVQIFSSKSHRDYRIRRLSFTSPHSYRPDHISNNATMVILGGLELVAAGYILHEHNKNKKEKQQVEAEEARLRAERRRRRKQHETSPDRPGRPDKKYDYAPPSAMKPSAAGNNLGIPSGPPGRASSQPPPGYTASPPGYPGPMQGPPYPNQPPPQGYGYGQYPPGPPPQQPRPQGLAADYYNPDNKYGPPGSAPQGPPVPGPQRPRRADSDPRRSSDPNLPQNYPGYQTGYPEGVAELSADGPWMHDEWRTSHQTPHVRFNFPDGAPQPGDDRSVRSPPPAYRP